MILDADKAGWLLNPDLVMERGAFLSRAVPIPTSCGVYGAFFRNPPPLPRGFNLADCQDFDGRRLLYIGKADGKRGLRQRIGYHLTGNCSQSTLRQSLAALLGLPMRLVALKSKEGTRPYLSQDDERRFLAHGQQASRSHIRLRAARLRSESGLPRL